MQARHILPLTGIRLFAAAWVVLYHFQGLTALFPALSLINPFCGLGYQAVPLFFLLSGFILSHNYFSNYSLSHHPKFIFLRFARLWPVHFVTLMLILIGPGLFQSKNLFSPSLIEELLMVRSWFHTDLSWNYPAWSISIEWFAYIFIFPLAFFLFKRIQSRAALISLVVLFLAAQAYMPSTLFPGQCGSIVFLFLAGSGLYRMYATIKNPPAEAITLCGVLLLSAYIVFSKHLSVLVLYSAFAFLVYGLSYERGFIAKVLSAKIIVRGGLISYSLYMTHALILRNYQFYFWDRLPHSLMLRFLIFLLLIGVLAMTAAVFYYFIEEPANKKLRSLVANRPLRQIVEQPIVVSMEKEN